jgi:hypothetical protein
MNLEIHRPELAQRVQAQIQTGHFHDVDELIEKALDALDEQAPAPVPAAGAMVLAALPSSPDREIDLTPPCDFPLQTAADIILDSMRTVPPEVMAAMPKDGASQHDHYIYGWPKREP